MRKTIQIFGWALIWSGIFIFGYLGWQLFGTDLVNSGVQAEAETLLSSVLSEAQKDPPDIEQVDPRVYLGDDGSSSASGPVAFYREVPPDAGEVMAFLRIPKIEVDQVLFEGVDRNTLKSGPGHMEGTPIPGQPGNSVVSGHRTTYGRPFFDFDLLAVGDLIEVETTIGVHSYSVREIMVVQPTDVWVTNERPGAWLTLTTCNPKFSARQRLVVFAEMISGPNLEYAALHKQRSEANA